MTRSKFVPRPAPRLAGGAYKNAKPIEVDGVTYASISAAARALGVSRASIRKGPRRSHGGGLPPVPCFGFPSMKAASEELHVDRRTLRKAIEAGREPIPSPPKTKGAPVRKRVGKWATIRAAADSIGVSPSCVSKRLRLKQNPLARPRGQSAEKYTRAIPSSSPSVEKSASRSSPLKSIGDKIPGGQSEENR